MNKVNSLEYSIMLSLLIIMLLGLNQGFAQENDDQLKTYQNEELGISFQYPGNWSESDEQFRKQITEMTKQSLIGQNLTSNEKAYADAVSVAFFLNQDPNNPDGITLINYDFPDPITVEEFNQIALKFTGILLGSEPPLIENVNTTISNKEANKASIEISEGPAKGKVTSIAFFNGNKVTNFQLGSVNNEDEALLMDRIINSIQITK